MQHAKEVVYVFWTCREKTEAKRVIYALLEKKWVACASILPEVESMYRWEGKIEHAHEVKVIFKTVSNHFDLICDYIIRHCSYQIPEVVQLKISQGNPFYLSWIFEETADV